jgi:uncharacterized Zn finger protein (UPF0148 family)
MKAKMTDKTPETGRYLCSKCNIMFIFKRGELVCPLCHNGAWLDMVLIHVNDYPKEEEMYSKDDWHGG